MHKSLFAFQIPRQAHLWTQHFTDRDKKTAHWRVCNALTFTAHPQPLDASVFQLPLEVADFKCFWLMGRTESKNILSHADYISVPGSAAIQRCLPQNPGNAQWATAEQGSTLQTAAHHLHPHRATLIKISRLHGLPCGVYTNCLLLLLTKEFLRGYHHPKEKLLSDLHVFYMRSSS